MNRILTTTLVGFMKGNKARRDSILLLNQHLPSNVWQTNHMAYDTTNSVHNKIHNLMKKSNKKVFLFMKGVPQEPQCGYSGAVVRILEAYDVDFDSCNILEDDKMRQEIKTYADWPTIPQVYKDGTFIGGCDALLEMHKSGELEDLFKDCLK